MKTRLHNIILDANVFYDDPNLIGAEFKLLELYVRRTNCLIIVPQVVFDEVVNKFPERVKGHLSEIESANHKLVSLTESAYLPVKPILNVELQKEEYIKRLRDRLMRIGAVVLEYPKVKHKELAERDLARKKPFSESGRGYRDGLIWASILEHLECSSATCVLITRNTRDFSHEKDPKALHPDLVADLKSKALTDRLILRGTLKDVLTEFVKPTLNHVEKIKKLLESGSYRSLNIGKVLDAEFQSIFDSLNDEVDLSHLGLELEEPFGISGLDNPEDVEIQEAIQLSENELYVELTANYGADVYAYLFRSEAYGLRKSSGVHVTDWDWNESFVQVEGHVTLAVTLNLTHDFSDQTTSVEVVECETLDLEKDDEPDDEDEGDSEY